MNYDGVLMQYLPDLYHDHSEDLQKLLSAFEQILIGPGGEGQDGLELTIANVPSLFDPDPRCSGRASASGTPKEFLPWLADWVALGRLQRVPEKQCRKIIANIVPLYAWRGTKKYLSEVIQLFFDNVRVTIDDEELPSFQVGVSRLGKDSRLGEDAPYRFYVAIKFQMETTGGESRDRLIEHARSIIELAKPAHTTYQLDCRF